MKLAVIARPPVYGGQTHADRLTAASAVPGVERIVRIRSHAATIRNVTAWRRGSRRDE